MNVIGNQCTTEVELDGKATYASYKSQRHHVKGDA